MARRSKVTQEHARDRHGLTGHDWQAEHARDHSGPGLAGWSHVHDVAEIDDGRVRVLRTDREKASAKDLVTCGSCGRSWDDAVITGVTPAPSARCPFEYYHEEES